MLKMVVAGLLSMTALVPPALAQGERSMDRGQWRRERAERLPAPAGADTAVPRPDRVGVAPRRDDAPPRFDRDRRDWDRPDRGRPDRDRPDRDRSDRDWRAAPGGWRGDRAEGLPRPPAPEAAPSPGPGLDRAEQRRAAPSDRVWRSERAAPRRYAPRGRPSPPAAVWRSERGDRWDRSWRRDPRYDWQGYRAERRASFRLPRYYAPYGWDRGYRRFGVGMPLAPVLYTPRYWIYDPYAYRLPEAEEPYRWVRYYDDALLVDIEDGTVVDVIDGIFG